MNFAVSMDRIQCAIDRRETKNTKNQKRLGSCI